MLIDPHAHKQWTHLGRSSMHLCRVISGRRCRDGKVQPGSWLYADCGELGNFVTAEQQQDRSQ